MNRLVNILILSLLFQSVQLLAQNEQHTGELVENIATTHQAEFGKAMLSPDREALYFVKSFDFAIKRGNVSQSIWAAEWKIDKKLAGARIVSHINNYYNNAVVGISKDGERMYLLGTYSNKERMWPGVSMSYRTDNGWTKPEAVHVEKLHIKSQLFDFFVTPDESAMFISMGESQFGQADLYLSQKNEAGTWTEPILLDIVNSDSTQEISPFYSEEFDALYFASDRKNGLGDFDIYASQKGASWSEWSAPTPLPKPVNSAGFDAYFTTYKDQGSFMVSNRTDSLSKLYYLHDFLPDTKSAEPASKGEEMALEEALTDVEGTFIYEDLPKGGVEVLLLDEDGNLVDKTITDENGLYKFTRLPRDHEYHVLYTDGSGVLDPELANMEENKIIGIETIEGLFSYNNLPKEGVKVVLVDENGNIIDETMTNDKGLYHFGQLPADRFYKVMYMDEVGDLDPNFANMGEKDAPALAENKPTIAKSPQSTKPKTVPAKTEKPVASSQSPKVDSPKPAGNAKLHENNAQQTVLFAFNEIIPGGNITIKLDRTLLRNKTRKIELVGHADELGTDEINMEVSRQRADNVKSYLVKNGYPAELITTKGVGKSQPVSSNDTPEGRAKNRRVEINY